VQVATQRESSGPRRSPPAWLCVQCSSDLRRHASRLFKTPSHASYGAVSAVLQPSQCFASCGMKHSKTLVDYHVVHKPPRQAYDGDLESLECPLSAGSFSSRRKGKPCKRLPQTCRRVPRYAPTTSTISNLHQIGQRKMRWKAQHKAHTMQFTAHIAMVCAASGLSSKHLLRAHRFNFASRQVSTVERYNTIIK
jgi:hypothetical protein